MKQTVLFLIPDLGHGGAERVLVNLANSMDKEQFEVTVMTLFDQGVNKKLLSPEVIYRTAGLKQIRGYSRLFAFVPARALYKKIVKERYDYVISYLEGAATRIISGCPWPDSKKVCWIHIELNDKRKLRAGFFSANAAINAYHQFDEIVCVSETVRQIFQKTAGQVFEHCMVLYNTVESDVIRSKAQEELSDVVFSSNTVNVCSVAKLMYSKGYDRLIRVHQRLLNEGVDHHIYILGVGEKEEELKHYAKENGLTDTFTLLGFRDNPYKYVAACDLYVCSSRREGFSTAVTEALIVGTPVVSTCCSGAYELLGYHEEYGIVTENSEEGIYNGMKKMLLNEALRRRYAEAARLRGEQFSKEKTTHAVEIMLQDLTI